MIRFSVKIQIIFTSIKASTAGSSDLSSVVDDAEISIVLEFLGFLELGVCALFLNHLLHKAFVRGFGEPALLI